MWLIAFTKHNNVPSFDKFRLPEFQAANVALKRYLLRRDLPRLVRLFCKLYKNVTKKKEDKKKKEKHNSIV